MVYGGESIRELCHIHELYHETELHDIAYDIKMIMNKGIIDIIRPEWIKDSVTKGELMPFKKKYVLLYFSA